MIFLRYFHGKSMIQGLINCPNRISHNIFIFPQKNRMCISMELVTAVLGDHGQRPLDDYGKHILF